MRVTVSGNMFVSSVVLIHRQLSDTDTQTQTVVKTANSEVSIEQNSVNSVIQALPKIPHQNTTNYDDLFPSVLAAI